MGLLNTGDSSSGTCGIKGVATCSIGGAGACSSGGRGGLCPCKLALPGLYGGWALCEGKSVSSGMKSGRGLSGTSKDCSIFCFFFFFLERRFPFPLVGCCPAIDGKNAVEGLGNASGTERPASASDCMQCSLCGGNSKSGEDLPPANNSKEKAWWYRYEVSNLFGWADGA